LFRIPVGDPAATAQFYMKQTGKLDNACGLIAMIHGVLNNGEVGIEAGSPLAQYQEANKASTPEERASSLEGFKAIQDKQKARAAEGQSAVCEDQSAVFTVYFDRIRMFHRRTPVIT